MIILAVGAHYDDIEIGCSGTILKHQLNGDDIYFAITSSDEYRTGKITNRRLEQINAANILKIRGRKIFMYRESETEADIIGHLDAIQPDIIFSPYENDTHQAHRRSSIIAQAVGRKRNITTLFYDSGSVYDFHPNVFSLVDFDKKLEVLNCYTSQISYGAINLDIVKKKNSYWASLITDANNEYAEGFVIRKMRWII